MNTRLSMQSCLECFAFYQIMTSFTDMARSRNKISAEGWMR